MMNDNPEKPAQTPNRLEEAIRRIDLANARDPRRVIKGDDSYPAELLYSIRMTDWLERLEKDASEALKLAVRCQHLQRWMIPRSQFPMTRAGYHQWRTTLARFHAEQAADILRSVGYDEPTIARVQTLIRKERLKSNAETQTLEDVACLVFLEGDYVEFARTHDPDKVIDILRKTWRKMSPRGQTEALSLAQSLPETEHTLIKLALSP